MGKSISGFLRWRWFFLLGFLLGPMVQTDQVAAGEIRIADSKGDWGYPNPYRHYPRGPGYVRMSLVFDTLVWKDEKGYIPALADSWSFDPGKLAFAFKLNPKTKWHDGQPLTAQDVGEAPEEEIVAVVETDMCAVDAIQYLTGCTLGKGNLIHRDYGKNAFTFYHRQDKKAIRIVMRPGAMGPSDDEFIRLRKKKMKEGLDSAEDQRLKEMMGARAKRIMEACLKELFEIKKPEGPVPSKARIMESLVCEVCGEATMESRTRRFLGQTLCIPCFETLEKR